MAEELHGLLGGTDIKNLLAKYDLAPTKKRGQNFVTDPNTVERIVRDAGVKDGDLIVEVGPGLGSLTLALLHKGATVIAVELDHGLAKALKEVTAGANIEVITDDATNVDWADLVSGRSAKMVANLPYNVATPIVMEALKQNVLNGYHVMVQKEVGERWCAAVGDKAFGAVSMKMALLADTKIAGTVSRQAFYPAPNVDSVTVEIAPYNNETTPFKDSAGKPYSHDLLLLACSLIDKGFSRRRKTLRNALNEKDSPHIEIDEILEKIGVNNSIRAEALTPKNWLDLTSLVYGQWSC